MGKPLLDSTYQLVDEADLTYREVADGAGVDINWFAKFSTRCIDDPGVKKVQAVHDYLRSLKRRSRPRRDHHMPSR